MANPLISQLTILALGTSMLCSCAYLTSACRYPTEGESCGVLHPTAVENASMLPPTYADERLKTRYSHKLLSDYVEQMAMSMVGNQPLALTAPIAVASFVQFDSTLTRSNILGNQIAESFIHELQQYGLPVADYKVTGAIRITPRGDFVFSRDVMELASDQSIGYILSGTIIQANDGVIVNARIVGLSTKVIVASAQQFIPGFVLNSLYQQTAQN